MNMIRQRQKKNKRSDEGSLEWVKLSDIEVVPGWQKREKTYYARVNEFAHNMQDGDKFPELEVANINGALKLTAGHHRLEALKHNAKYDGGLQEALCLVRKQTEQEAHATAFLSNCGRHGIRYKPKETRQGVKDLLNDGFGRNKWGQFIIRSWRAFSKAIKYEATDKTLARWVREDCPEIAALIDKAEREEGYDDVGKFEVKSSFERRCEKLEAELEALEAAARGWNKSMKNHVVSRLAKTAQKIGKATAWKPVLVDEDEDF